MLQDIIKRLEGGETGLMADAAVRYAVGYSDVGHPKPYTTSTDAALSLLREKLPDVIWVRDADGTIRLLRPGGCAGGLVRVSASPPGLDPAPAILIAILKALEMEDA